MLLPLIIVARALLENDVDVNFFMESHEGYSDHCGILNLLSNIPVTDFGACINSLMIDFQQFTILSLVKSK